MMKTRSSFVLMVVAALGLLAVSSGCVNTSRAPAYCDQLCECEGCSDLELEECVIDIDYAIASATVYECNEEYDAFLACQEENAECVAEYWAPPGDECMDEAQDYWDCITEASDLWEEA